jgi:hypothetical protein
MVDHVGWRWIFWLNLPVSGVALLLVAFFLRVSHSRAPSLRSQLTSIDYVGNLFLIAAVTSILIALSGANAVDRWGSWQKLVPLVLGLVGLPIYVIYEASPLCREPTTPLRLFSNRTSAVAFLLSFLHGMLLYWVSYFLPVYFQAVLEASPQQSGINTLAAAIPMVPFGIIGGIWIAKAGHYKLNQVVGFAIASIAIGCFSILDQNSPKVVWVILQILFAAGAGVVLTATLPAIQAPLPESDVASSTATWGFVQSLGFVVGVAVPSSVFESRFNSMLYRIGDEGVRDVLRTNGAYEHASRSFITSLPRTTRVQVIAAFVDSLRIVWEVGVGFAVLGFFASFLVQDIELRKELETEFGYREDKGTNRNNLPS